MAQRRGLIGGARHAAEYPERARRYLSRWRSLKDRLPIARLLGEVFADSGYDAATQLEFLGDRKLRWRDREDHGPGPACELRGVRGATV